MKHSFSAVLTSFLLIFLLGSCERAADEQLPGDDVVITPVQSFSAQIGGNPMNVLNISHQLLDDSIHVFIVTSTVGEVLTIRSSSIEVGTYDMDFEDPTITLFSGGYMYDQTPAPSGSITITENTGTRLTGTFETAVSNIAETGQTIEITSGVFENLEY